MAKFNRNRAVTSIRLDPKNARLHDNESKAIIRASLEEVGAFRSIGVDGDDIVRAGNGVYEQAQNLGLKVRVVDAKPDELVAVRRRDLKGQKAVRAALLDNRTGELSEWDPEVLGEFNAAGLLEGLNMDEFLAQIETEIAEGPPAKIDKAAELQVKWNTAPGQLWLAGDHRLLCGDSTVEADVLRLMNGRRASLFATDPPYLVAYDGTNHPHVWTKTHGHKHPGDKDWSDKYTDVDSPELGETLYEAFIALALKVAIAQDAAWYCWHASRKQALLESVWDKHGAFVHQQIIWAKDRPILTRSWYMWQHEPCFFGWIKGKKPRRCAKDYPPSVWSFPTIAAGETTVHPTEKPVALFAIPIKQHTIEGEVCYEPFAGSGTQLVAAQQLERVCYAMEKSPPFVAVALERLADMGLKPELASAPAKAAKRATLAPVRSKVPAATPSRTLASSSRDVATQRA